MSKKPEFRWDRSHFILQKRREMWNGGKFRVITLKVLGISISWLRKLRWDRGTQSCADLIYMYWIWHFNYNRLVKQTPSQKHVLWHFNCGISCQNRPISFPLLKLSPLCVLTNYVCLWLTQTLGSAKSVGCQSNWQSSAQRWCEMKITHRFLAIT